MVVHSVLPARLTAEVERVLSAAGVAHAAHTDEDPVAAGATAAGDDAAVALIGPFRSREVAETVEATAPAGLPLIAPMATWAGVTRADEPGCDDPARHQGTVFRLLARDTEVAARVAADVTRRGCRALVVAGESEYGVQLDGQLRLAGLPRAPSADEADLVVLCGLAGEPEIERAFSIAPLPVIAFDGVQGADLGLEQDVQLALPFAPSHVLGTAALFAGLGQARNAAELVVELFTSGAHDRVSMLARLRDLGTFDEHGDPVQPDVWLWRADQGWTLEPQRALDTM
jgi:hypothetical protein